MINPQITPDELETLSETAGLLLDVVYNILGNPDTVPEHMKWISEMVRQTQLSIPHETMIDYTLKLFDISSDLLMHNIPEEAWEKFEQMSKE